MKATRKTSGRATACLLATGLVAAAATAGARDRTEATAATTATAADGDRANRADVDTLEIQLSGIDFLPDRGRLADVAPNDPATALIAISKDPGALPGQRVRALRSLAEFPSPRVRTILLDALGRYRESAAGIDLLYLRATLEALARSGGDDTWVIISNLFEHRSPDIRAAVARALGDLGDPAATGELFRRLDLEKVPFVRIAIERALRDLQPR